MKPTLAYIAASAAALCAATSIHTRDTNGIIITSLQPNSLPRIGLGTFGINNRSTAEFAINTAFAAGFRHVDTAMIYQNEVAIGAGIQYALDKQNLTRQDIWVTTKLWNSDHGDPLVGLKASLARLNLTYVDLYLMHFPLGPAAANQTPPADYIEVYTLLLTKQTQVLTRTKTWKKMEKLLQPNGLVRQIGISNFSPTQLENLLASASIKPAIHQFELHPFLPQTTFVKRHAELGIPVTAYAPLGNTSPFYSFAAMENKAPPLLQNSIIKAVAAARGCSAAQVVLAWNLKRGVAVIPKAAKEQHIKENIRVPECLLTDEDSSKIDSITVRGRFNNPCRRMRAQCFQGLDNSNQGF
jgi:alcohol dehydrogenase (NADP+)